jgi:hypothetical protein
MWIMTPSISSNLLCPEHIMVIASGSVLDIHKENMVQVLFLQTLDKVVRLYNLLPLWPFLGLTGHF